LRKWQDPESPEPFILGVVKDVTAQVHSRRRFLRERHDLIERNKELTCLYGISRISENHEISLPALFSGCLALIPPAFQYPAITSARIQLDGQSFRTPDFVDSGNCLLAPVTIQGRERGFIKVVYPRRPPRGFVGRPTFLREETSLLHTLARQISLMVERREMEERKSVLEGQLRHADRLAKIGLLAAGVAHELNEPLAGILGFAQLAGKHAALPEQVGLDLENIVKCSLHAREVIKKLMLFSRQMPPQSKDINLNDLIRDGLYFLQSRCAKNGIEIVQRLSENLPGILGDPAQLNQVIVNLVINGSQAMPQGGTLTIETSFDEQNVFLSVTDTGTGMEPEVLSQIFLPFFTTKEVDEGTGLGLAVVHGIISVHNGTISVDSHKGLGTCFHIRFQRIDAGNHVPGGKP
jgi:signal transduction histidine kinase